MSLNDLGQDFEDVNVATTTGNDGVTPEGFNFEEKIPDEEDCGKDIVLIDNTEKEIVLVKAGTNSVVDMTDLIQNMVAESGVCKADYYLIKDTFGTTCLEGLNEKTLTINPSKTNYNFVLNKTRSKLATEQESITNKLSSIHQNLKSDIDNALIRLSESYLNDVRQAIQLSIAQYPNMSKNLSNGLYIILYYDETKPTLDIAKKDLTTGYQRSLFNRTYSASIWGKDEYGTAYARLHVLGDWKHVRLLAYCISNNKKFYDVVTSAEISEAKQYTPTLKDLVELCCSEKGLSLVDDIQTLATGVQTSIKDIIVDESTFQSANEEVLDKICDKLHYAKECIAACYYLSRVMSTLNKFYPFIQSRLQ